MTRQRWIDAGLALLADEGVQAITIDRVAASIGLTKGSFFHHFPTAAAYRAALVETWQHQALEADGAAEPRSLLEDLASRVGDLFDVRLERAMRAWALQDPDVAAAVAAVDEARLAALEGIWRRLVDDPERAHVAALIPHLLVIGASVAQPPVSRSALESVFGLLAELIPSVQR